MTPHIKPLTNSGTSLYPYIKVNVINMIKKTFRFFSKKIVLPIFTKVSSKKYLTIHYNSMYAVNSVYERNDSISLQVHALNVIELLRHTIFYVNI